VERTNGGAGGEGERNYSNASFFDVCAINFLLSSINLKNE
jgi:hypothetical protein